MAVTAAQSASFLRALTSLTHLSEGEGGGESEGADTIPRFVRQAAKNALESLRQIGAQPEDNCGTDFSPKPNSDFKPNSNSNEHSHSNPDSNPTLNPNPEADTTASAAMPLAGDMSFTGFVQDELTTAAAVEGIGAVCEALVHLLHERPPQHNDNAESVSSKWRSLDG